MYTSTRSDDSITTFAVEEGGAQLKYIQHIPSGGKCPVHFGLDPNCRYLWCANSGSQNVVCFEIAPAEEGGALAQRTTLTLPAAHGPGYVSSPQPQVKLLPFAEAVASRRVKL